MVELKFWYLNMDCFNGYSIKPLPTPSVVIFTDASDVAFGEFYSNLKVFFSVSCMWLRDENARVYILRAYSDILRELFLCQGVGEQKSESPHAWTTIMPPQLFY